MTKNTSVQLISYIGFILAGLVLSQLILLASFMVQHGVEFINHSDSKSIIESLSGRQLLIQQLISQVCSLILPSFVFYQVFMRGPIPINSKAFDTMVFFKCALLFFLLLPLVGWSAYLNQLFPLPEWANTAETEMLALMEKMFQSKTPSDFILGLIAIAIIPAIAEEWAFRAVIQNCLIRITGKAWVGLFLASLVFSAVHFQFQGFLPRFLLGWILGFIYLQTGQLWYSVLLHFLNNAIQLVTIFTLQDKSLQELLQTSEMPNVFATIAFTIAAIWLGLKYFRTRNRIHHA
ncbi:MAG: CPBP family intramembrane metalloprotease [Saprospiraceae bacterium]|nr:CPBP family intramembrane metalloprotease [Saprospiraceae bacterium]